MNGRYDNRFPLEASGRPLINLFGAPRADKKLVILENRSRDGGLSRHHAREPRLAGPILRAGPLGVDSPLRLGYLDVCEQQISKFRIFKMA